tara:strand:+ start:41 stop:433 length:393 start_codon:yes stop_codon:yes gene_type:complete
MAFKLGSSRTPALNKGQVQSKHSFNKDDASVPGTPVLRKDLGKGIMGEANNDGTIFISHDLQPGSEDERHVIMHEMVHQTDMKLGKLKYTDSSITWNGETHARQDGMIQYNDQWFPEGSKDFPWEKMPWE